MLYIGAMGLSEPSPLPPAHQSRRGELSRFDGSSAWRTRFEKLNICIYPDKYLVYYLDHEFRRNSG